MCIFQVHTNIVVNMSTRTYNGWTGIEMVGLLLIALGAAFFAYSAYNYFASPALPRHLSGSGGASTQTGSSQQATAASGRIYNRSSLPVGTTSFRMPILLTMGDMLSGILMALLGLVTFKYGGLRKILKAR